jgi:hypothetical protein
MTNTIINSLFGPFKVGEYVLEGATEFGRVFRAGPKRVWIIWANSYATVSCHSQDTRVFRRVVGGPGGAWQSDEVYERKTKDEIQAQFVNWQRIMKERAQ